ncbi:hypothetical protein GOB86_04875 [Acetobacter lambici]|uniref:Lipoprotein n=1 Tax=Acetobacter lambici TaxID=1332824 RepID=A0ABT1EWY4_9PROT|nr:hypothetical protein [Acetobacter lambici]MCP1241928.1 hypothetical protein [Acetobacter lambici]MCP1257453.1 hypothetical protein [Acetobacter lambici]NHO56407.1 hypothetical protein [Acetobacter lambici]
MLPFPRMRLSHLLASLILPAALAGCADQPQQTKFAPLSYDYLGQIHLNVATLDVVDNSVTNPEPGDIGYRSPSPPDHTLRQMAADRLMATGNTAAATTAHFVIDRAFILHQPGGTLDGQMDIHLDILNTEGKRVASASAQATQTLHPDPSQDVESPANLYEITKDMMQTINVEFEYQIRHSLNKWLVDAGGTPMNNAIQTQSLTGAPDAPPVAGTPSETSGLTELQPGITVPSTTPATSAGAAQPPASTDTPSSIPQPAATPAPATAATQESEPNAIFPAGMDDTPAQAKTLSPKAGFLTLPSSTKTH